MSKCLLEWQTQLLSSDYYALMSFNLITSTQLEIQAQWIKKVLDQKLFVFFTRNTWYFGVFGEKHSCGPLGVNIQ